MNKKPETINTHNENNKEIMEEKAKEKIKIGNISLDEKKEINKSSTKEEQHKTSALIEKKDNINKKTHITYCINKNEAKENNKLNKKRERIKEDEQNINNINVNDWINKNKDNSPFQNNTSGETFRRKTSFIEAKREIEEFAKLIEKTEDDIIKKYNITFPNFSFEKYFPDELKSKLIDNFLETTEMKDILVKLGNQNL